MLSHKTKIIYGLEILHIISYKEANFRGDEMKIWVDADACPNSIKEIILRAAVRTETETIFVANKLLRLPLCHYISFLGVEQGADIADDKIAEECSNGDLIITADIPLAVRVVEKGALGLDPRGTVYDNNNIRQISSMRDFMQGLRNDGVETGGPKSFHQRDIQKFANNLDKILARS